MPEDGFCPHEIKIPPRNGLSRQECNRTKTKKTICLINIVMLQEQDYLTLTPGALLRLFILLFVAVRSL